MKKSAAALVAIVALTLTGCASTPEATGGKNIVQTIDSTAGVATGLITKTLAKNLPASVDQIADVAKTLIENEVADAK